MCDSIIWCRYCLLLPLLTIACAHRYCLYFAPLSAGKGATLPSSTPFHLTSLLEATAAHLPPPPLTPSPPSPSGDYDGYDYNSDLAKLRSMRVEDYELQCLKEKEWRAAVEALQDYAKQQQRDGGAASLVASSAATHGLLTPPG